MVTYGGNFLLSILLLSLSRDELAPHLIVSIGKLEVLLPELIVSMGKSSVLVGEA